MASQRTVTPFMEAVCQRIREVEQQGQGTQLMLDFHARGKDSFWELRTTTFERFRLVTDRQFLAVE